MTIKTYVFGDTGGHSLQLFASLTKIGVDLNKFTIPKNIKIIHCGDLIHKGPDSKLLLSTVDSLIRNNPNQWIQLLGNHEFQHIEGSPHFWKCKCDLDDIGIIDDWFDEGLAFTAYGLDNILDIKLEVSAKPKISVPTKSVLFTHGGLTNFWWNALSKPETAKLAAAKINSLPVEVMTSPGLLLGVQNLTVGPVWAIGNEEVFKSWTLDNDKNQELPFILIHGHTTSYDFVRNKWWRADPQFKKFRTATKLNPVSRAVITEIAGSLLVGIDPGFGAKADIPNQPFLLLTLP